MSKQCEAGGVVCAVTIAAEAQVQAAMANKNGVFRDILSARGKRIEVFCSDLENEIGLQSATLLGDECGFITVR